MEATTLYQLLGVPGQTANGDLGRTERTTAPETIDRDRAVIDLYGALGDPVPAAWAEVGRTEVTRERPETVDRDRASELLNSTLMGRPTDLYAALSRPPRGEHLGSETALTASTETIDWDRPPELPALH